MTYHAYDYILVLMSYAVSVLGSFTALRLSAGIKHIKDRRRRWKRLVLAAVVMGLGAIWTMHFIGMLALKMPIQVSYNLGLTILSALVAIGACLVGLAHTSRGDPSTNDLLTAGTYMGVGVAIMHYMGMAAMRMPATIVYDGAITSLSFLIAIVAAVAALWMASKSASVMQSLIGALAMGVAVCGMHYTGMAAAQFVTVGKPDNVVHGTINSMNLGLALFGIITALLIGVWVGMLRRSAHPVADH